MEALFENRDLIHTTELGKIRIKKNLGLTFEDVIAWCKTVIFDKHTVITRKGKNWYARSSDCCITINAYSYTIITAHKVKN